MPWSETILEPASTKDFALRKSAVRRFRVWGGPTREQIVQQPDTVQQGSTAQSLPAIGSKWNGMFLDSYTAVGVGGDRVYDVTAFYSTEGQRQREQGGFQTETVQVPYNARGSTILPSVAAGPTSGQAVVYAWEVRYQPFLMSVGRMQVLVIHKASQSRNLLYDQIAPQINRLHFVWGGTVAYRFEGADLRMLGLEDNGERAVYEIIYSWVTESGVRTVGDLSQADTTNLQFPGVTTSQVYGSAGWIVPPFERLVPYKDVAAGSSFSTANPYQFKAVLPYVIEASGWATLPGLVRP